MTNERCVNCGFTQKEHIGQNCPRTLSVAIDADALERLNRTGHPRLLRNLLSGSATGGFAGVEIQALRVVEADREARLWRTAAWTALIAGAVAVCIMAFARAA